MALQARHLYIAHRIDEALGIGNSAVTEELLRQPSILNEINKFFTSKGPPCIFIYHLMAEEANLHGWNVERPLGKKWKLGRPMDPHQSAAGTISSGKWPKGLPCL